MGTRIRRCDFKSLVNPEQRYRAWHRSEEELPFALGEVQFVQVAEDTWIANMIAQRDVRTINGIPPIRYNALRKALQRVAEEANRIGASIHMPRIGCGLAGGTWDEVGTIVQQELADKGIAVTVYDFPTAQK